MPDRANIAYIYDGSWEGLLCCVFESFEKREIPAVIRALQDSVPTLYPERYIETDAEKAKRVTKGIITKISIDAYELAGDVYFSCHPEKELLVCDFVRIGLANGKKTTAFWANPVVNDVLKASKQLGYEAHQLTGFVRFSVYGAAMVSVIEPKNYVLPRLAPHFCDRYANETFMIYDKTHSAALVYRPREWRIIPVSDFSEPAAGEEERYYRAMWKTFYDTIAIKERENPRCRMSHMQKRYWSHLTEMQGGDYFAPPDGLPPADTGLKFINSK